jgi:hypothetical protein
MCRIWEELRKGSTPEMVAQEQDELLTGMQGAFHALDRLQNAAESFEVCQVKSSEYRGCITLRGLEILHGQSCALTVAKAKGSHYR